MSREKLKIGVVATASRLSPEVAEQVPAVARVIYGEAAPQIVFHAGSYASAGHFAGDDAARARAFLEVANDESFDVLWFARGGWALPSSPAPSCWPSCSMPRPCASGSPAPAASRPPPA